MILKNLIIFFFEKIKIDQYFNVSYISKQNITFSKIKNRTNNNIYLNLYLKVLVL